MKKFTTKKEVVTSEVDIELPAYFKGFESNDDPSEWDNAEYFNGTYIMVIDETKAIMISLTKGIGNHKYDDVSIGNSCYSPFDAISKTVLPKSEWDIAKNIVTAYIESL